MIWNIILIITILGFAMPFITLHWSQVIGGELIYHRSFTDSLTLVLLGFNFVSFLSLLLIGAYLLKDSEQDRNKQFVKRFAFTGASLGVFAVTIYLQMTIFISTSSTTGLMFLVYLPYVAIAMGVGYVFGGIIGAAEERLFEKNRRGFLYSINAVLFSVFIVLNVHTNNFGRFNLPAIPDVVLQKSMETAGKNVSIQKDIFIDVLKNVGAISSMGLVNCSQLPNADITLIGGHGVAYISKNGTVASFIKFEEPAGFDVFPIDIENDGLCEFVDNAGGWSPVGLIDHDGNYIWRYGEGTSTRHTHKYEVLIDAGASPEDIIAFDANNDGDLDFLVPLLIVGKNETSVLTKNGKILQKLDYNLRDSKTADIDHDGDDELISTIHTRDVNNNTRANKIVIRDNSLKIINRFPITCSGGSPSRGCTLRIAKWPDSLGTWHAFLNYLDTIQVINLATGNVTKQYRTGIKYKSEMYIEKIIPVRFIHNKDPFLVTATPSERRITLSIYDPDSNLIYSEILRGGVELMALPDAIDNSESLLVSECGENFDGSRVCGRVWKYNLREPQRL